VEDEERVVVCSCGANHIGNDLGSSCRGLVVSFCKNLVGSFQEKPGSAAGILIDSRNLEGKGFWSKDQSTQSN
jgi:hypothetical protein